MRHYAKWLSIFHNQHNDFTEHPKNGTMTNEVNALAYHLYCDDIRVASFDYERGTILSFRPEKPELLPMQIRNASAEMFTLWLQERAIDLNTFVHRELMHNLLGSRDRIAIAILTNMFSITDAFTCFKENVFMPRNQLWSKDTQDAVSDFVLESSETSLRQRAQVTPNASTDGSFPKTWKFENGAWWLYKLQSEEATRSEEAISKALRACGWDAAEYAYNDNNLALIKSKNFVGKDEFFEPYESLRYMFDDRSDADAVIYANICSLGAYFEKAFRRILLADALFMNTDRHMRNFGIIRCAKTGELLRMAPNFDNNQAYKAMKGTTYGPAMLRAFQLEFGITKDDHDDLHALASVCRAIPYLYDVGKAVGDFLAH